MDKVEEKYKKITSELTPDYLKTIDTLVKININSIVSDHCNNLKASSYFDKMSNSICNDIKTKTVDFVDKLCKEKFLYLSDSTTNIEKKLAENAEKLIKNACKKIENCAKTFTEAIDMDMHNFEESDINFDQYIQIILLPIPIIL